MKNHRHDQLLSLSKLVWYIGFSRTARSVGNGMVHETVWYSTKCREDSAPLSIWQIVESSFLNERPAPIAAVVSDAFFGQNWRSDLETTL